MEIVLLVIAILTLLAVLGLYGAGQSEPHLHVIKLEGKRSAQAKQQKRDGHGRFTA